MVRSFAFAALLFAAGCGGSGSNEGPSANAAAAEPAAEQAAAPARAAPAPVPDVARVRLQTGLGPILIELDGKRAPITAGNFLRYVDEGRFDGTSFYRAAPTKGAEGKGFIQGGIRRNYRKMLPPIEHEPTSATGLRHGEGAISMAHTEPGRAMGEFFITASAMPSMDAREGKPGYAAFGRVVEGMEVVRKILASPTAAEAGRGAMRGQMIAEPVAIVRAERVQ